MDNFRLTGANRSWLESADVAFLGKQKQLMLILDNCNIGITPNQDILSAVTDCWKAALQLMENIVAGQPMAVRSGEVLLAMSSWHLYPDLEVLGNKPTTIRQSDPLIARGGIVTLGLESPNMDTPFGISWALPLSHLRYYGKAVLATGVVSSSDSRVPMGHLLTVALGSAIGKWARTWDDVGMFAEIAAILEKALADDDAPIPGWISLLSLASRMVRDASGETKTEHERLFDFGRRRATQFLSPEGSNDPPPWLNLTDPLTFCGLLKHSEAKIRFLRHLYDDVWSKNVGESSSLKFALIGYSLSQDEIRSFRSQSHPYLLDCLESSPQVGQCEEFVSLAPIYVGSDGRPSHRRWIPSVVDRYHDLGVDRYYAVSTFSALRAQHVQRQLHESVTFLSGIHWNGYPGQVVWDTPHTRTQPSSLLGGSELSNHPDFEELTHFGGLGRTDHTHVSNIRQALVGGKASFWNSSLPKWLKDPLPKEIQRVELALEDAKSRIPGLRDVALNTPSKSKSRDMFEQYLQNAFTEHSPRQFGSSHNSTSEAYSQSSKATLGCHSSDAVSMDHRLHDWYVKRDTGYRSARHNTRMESLMSEVAQPSKSIPSIGVYLNRELITEKEKIPSISPQELLKHLKSGGHLDAVQIARLLSDWVTSSWAESLNALWWALELYENLPGARVQLSVVNNPLRGYRWSPSRHDVDYDRRYEHLASAHRPSENEDSSRARAFACIATFETGGLDINPSTITGVMGVSVGNSLYISRLISSDPYLWGSESTIGRCIGNVGKRGLAFLISPENPMVKEPGYDRWKLVQHAPFNGTLEDNFTETSLHLSLTGYQQPLFTGEHGLQDNEIYFIQSVVQVYDRGNWVADIDILKAFASARKQESIKRLSDSDCIHNQDQALDFTRIDMVKAIDCWDEIIDEPDGTSITRAKGNGLARLALTVVAHQKKKRVLVADGKVCWACVKAATLSSSGAIVIC